VFEEYVLCFSIPNSIRDWINCIVTLLLCSGARDSLLSGIRYNTLCTDKEVVILRSYSCLALRFSNMNVNEKIKAGFSEFMLPSDGHAFLNIALLCLLFSMLYCV
jgi:hypothetical protein